MSKCCFCIILFLSLVEIAVSQEVAITRQAFENAFTSSLEKAQEFSRYHKSTLIKYSGGNVERKLTWKWEYEMAYKHRMVFEEKTDARVSRLERFSLEEKTFCNIDNGGWGVETGSCRTRLPCFITQMSYMMRPNSPSHFTSDHTEKGGEKLTIFRESGKLGLQETKKGEWWGYYKSTFWVDSRGRFLRQSYKSGTVGSNQLSETWEDEISYSPNIKIGPPIK